ncbi:hypothetical protein B8A42_00280, partial [Dolosigranulum pigrum]
SVQVFASGFLQIPPHDGHPCLWLIIPTVKAYSGLSPPSCRPCQAHSNNKVQPKLNFIVNSSKL